MKQKIADLIIDAANRAHESGELPSASFPAVEVEVPKVESQGDFASNLAMIMAGEQKMAPRRIAEAVLHHMEDTDEILAKTEIAGPGFINFFINPSAWLPFLRKVHDAGPSYGASKIGRGRKVQLEFVSANPTGPLHVGHGRGAAVGDAVASILAFSGFDVQREYYINDSGRQIQTLGRSVFLRYREFFGEKITFPEDCYQGAYIRDLAETIRNDRGDDLLSKEADEAIMYCARSAAATILTGIRDDLESFGVKYDKWFSEQSLYDNGLVDGVIKDFQQQEIIYKKDDALWFRTTDYGDEKDRVVVRSNGRTTYFASDIAYHQEKYSRGFDKVVDVWGADHHGYVPRMRASIEASGKKRDQFDVILVHLVNLLRAGEPVAMSTRAGEFVTLKDVIDDVGRDAARFIFLTRHYESSLDFDLELAKKKSNDNPVYYVQYVHARISSIIGKGRERGIEETHGDPEILALIKAPEEMQLIKAMAQYPETVAFSAKLMEPHRITYYLMNLASLFHAYYNKHRVLTDDQNLAMGRLYLVTAVQKVIHNGLSLLGVSAPDKM